jgi:acyl carrier protein
LDKQQIRTGIEEILSDKFNIYLDTKVGDAGALNFFGRKINLNVRDMLYLFYMLEQKWGVNFDDSDVDDNSFYSLGGITDIIYEKLNH